MNSSPEFGKHKSKTTGVGDIQNLIEEIEKRKDGLSSLQDMLLYSKKGESNDENKSEMCNRSTEIMTTEGNDDFKGKQV